MLYEGPEITRPRPLHNAEVLSSETTACDKQGKPYSVRYEAVNAMLLNEFLKEHKVFVEEQRKVRDQGVTIARLEKQLAALLRNCRK